MSPLCRVGIHACHRLVSVTVLDSFWNIGEYCSGKSVHNKCVPNVWLSSACVAQLTGALSPQPFPTAGTESLTMLPPSSRLAVRRTAIAAAAARRHLAQPSSVDRAHVLDVPFNRHMLPDGLLVPRQGTRSPHFSIARGFEHRFRHAWFQVGCFKTVLEQSSADLSGYAGVLCATCPFPHFMMPRRQLHPWIPEY